MKPTTFFFRCFFLCMLFSCTQESDLTLDFGESPQSPVDAEFDLYVTGNTVRVDASNNFADEYLWDFGNGITTSERNPEPFDYKDLGSYSIQLTVTEEGRSSSTSKTAHIKWQQRKDFPGPSRWNPVYFQHGEYWYYGLGNKHATQHPTRNGPDKTSQLYDWWKYDPKNDQWSELNAFEKVQDEGLYQSAVTVVGNHAYMLANEYNAFSGSRYYFLKYHFDSDTWERQDELPLLTEYYRSAYGFTHQEQVYVALVHIINKTITIMRYDPASNEAFVEAEMEDFSNAPWLKQYYTSGMLYLVGSGGTYTYNFGKKEFDYMKGFNIYSYDKIYYQSNFIKTSNRSLRIFGGIRTNSFGSAWHQFFGGSDVSQYELFDYDLSSGTSTLVEGEGMPYPNASFAFFQMDGYAIMVGGAARDHRQSVWEYALK